MLKIITIDGPSGTGKGTIAARLASTLNWRCLDSGALYRILGHLVKIHGIAFDDTVQISKLAKTMKIEFKDGLILLDGVSVEDQIRTEEAGMNASKVAKIPAVREALLQWQRNFAGADGLVADGRDMGTVVFPDAPLKLFLSANSKERARRRYEQLKERGINANIARLIKDIEARDKQDRERTTAPLRVADGALEIDTSDLSIDQVLLKIEQQIKQVFPDIDAFNTL